MCKLAHMQRLVEGTVVTVRFANSGGVEGGEGGEREITCVVVGVLERFVRLLPVTPARAPSVDTLVELSSGAVQFRATVQEASHDIFSVLRPVDVVVGHAG